MLSSTASSTVVDEVRPVLTRPHDSTDFNTNSGQQRSVRRFTRLSLHFRPKRQTDPPPPNPFPLDPPPHDLMLPLPPRLTRHDHQSPPLQHHIHLPPRPLRLPRFPRPHTPIMLPRQLVKPHHVRPRKSQPTHRLAEAEILHVRRYAQAARVLVDDAEGRARGGGVEAVRGHAVEEKGEFGGGRGRGEDRLLDLEARGWGGGTRGLEAVGAAVVKRAAGEVGAPGLGGEEGEEVGFFGGGDEGGDDGEAGRVGGDGGYGAWDGGGGGFASVRVEIILNTCFRFVRCRARARAGGLAVVLLTCRATLWRSGLRSGRVARDNVWLIFRHYSARPREI